MKKDRRVIAAAQWYSELCRTNNETFIPLFFDEHRYLVLKGGGGSGKSIFAGRKLLERVTSEPNHRFLVCRKVADTLRHSCFEQLCAQIAEYYPGAGAKINKTDMTITFRNGSKIIFKGLDDPEKLKSIYNITGIWIEEATELDESDFNQLDVRLRTEFPHYLQIMLSFNPVSVTHWLKARFFDRRDPRAITSETTYKDNRFLTKEAIETLEAFKETDEYYYTVYCLGQWGTTGRTVFAAMSVQQRITQAPKPLKTGYFEYDLDADGVHISSPRWVDDPDGPCRIYVEPGAGVPYVAGGDTAGEGSDRFVGQFLDNTTGQQVCVLQHRYDEDTYARQMYCLGLHYNEALLAIETNFSTYPVKLLQLMGYKKLYVREVFDSFENRIKHSFGFQTNSVTRPVIISDLVRIMRDNIHLVNDTQTLYEMLTFIKSKTFRPEAAPGAHDDLVMALCIAFHARSQQSFVHEDYSVRVQWREDQWEDYYAASSEERAEIIKRWGKPM